MSKNLTFEISAEVFALLEIVAAETGRTAEAVALEWLASTAPKPRPKLSKKAMDAAEQRFLQHAGAISSGDPHSADNDRIDADLAREYGSTHADES